MNIFELEKEAADIARLIAAKVEQSQYEKALALTAELKEKIEWLLLDK